MDIIQISTAARGSNEDRIVRNLFSVLRSTLPVQLIEAEIRKPQIAHSLASIVRQVTRAAKADAVVIHSPFVFSLPACLVARMFQKCIVVIAWDSYPILINGRRYDTSLTRRLADLGERLVLKLATRKVIPTSDFHCDSKLADADVIPFWHGCGGAGRPRRKGRPPNSPMKIVFAGQINETRGVREALLHLDLILQSPAEVHLFSRDRASALEKIPFQKVTVHHQGYLARANLVARLDEFDFGLITLHPALDVPGFPSKVIDYLCASLPTLFFGRRLPAFSRLLESTQVGQDITDLSELDLKAESTRFADIAACRKAFEDAIEAKAGTFDHLFGH